MRFFTSSKQFYAGVDLHARSHYLCIIDRERKILVHKNLRNQDTDKFLSLLAPYKQDLVVACESTYAWYWLGDLCSEHGIEFILGHALYMKAIHGGKTKNDKIDSHKIALLAQAGMFPLAYVYPKEQRPMRDLLRRRLYFTRTRADLLCHLQLMNTQYNFPFIGKLSKSQIRRKELMSRFNDPDIKKSITADTMLVDYYGRIIKELEQHILSHVRINHTKEFAILQSLRGIGDIIALTILFESGNLARFATVGQYASYARLVTCPRESAGKLYGATGKKIGNPYLKHIYSEAAVYAVKFNPNIERYFENIASKKGKGKAYAIIAHRIAKAVFCMLKNGTVFDEKRFLNNDFRPDDETRTSNRRFKQAKRRALKKNLILR